MICLKYLLTIYISILIHIYFINAEDCSQILQKWNKNYLLNLTKAIIPDLEGKKKGDAGRIAVVGGSEEYTGAPYFAAISSLKVGADLVTVITTKNAAPIIKSYSPDLIVIPNVFNLSEILSKKDIIILGPGLGRAPEGMNLAYDVIKESREMQKPLVIDADGLYAIYKNISIIKDYPSPGVILTPNFVEAKRLKKALPEDYDGPWHEYWGNFVTVLEKGEIDQYHSYQGTFDWSLNESGSGRRAGGQGDILSGALGTFLNWSLNSKICEKAYSVALAQSVAAYAASIFTRTCNFKAFSKHGRSMIASDMLNEIHPCFDELFL